MIRIENKEEFKQVFEQYYLPLCHFLKNYTKENELIEDVVQDVFVKLWDKRSEIEVNNLKSYLFTAVKNLFMDYKKKENNHKKYVKEEEYIREKDQEDRVKKKDEYLIKQKIYNSLRHLPPKTREIFEMSKFNGLTYVEIATNRNISVKTVEAHMSKALRLIRENWEY